MKAITLYQPYASYCVVPSPRYGSPAKQHETRSWELPEAIIGQRVLIHAAKKWTADQQDFYKAIRMYFPAQTGHLPEELPLGCIIGSVVFLRDLPAEVIREFVDPVDRRLGDYATGRRVWQMIDAIAFDEPIPFRGRQQFFNVPDDLVASVSHNPANLRSKTSSD